jgi:hypothetical protein
MHLEERYIDNLERFLKVKQRQKEEAMHMKDTHRLATEIEDAKGCIMYLVDRNIHSSIEQ